MFEVLLHIGTQVGDWNAKQIDQAVLTTIHLAGVSRLPYDQRVFEGGALLEREGSRYA